MENNILESSIELINEKVHFSAICQDKPAISIDYTPPYGDGLGYTSLELLLLSLSSCAASSVAIILRKMQKTISELKVHATGIRHTEHPTGFRTVILEFRLTSPDLLPADVEKALALSEDKLCPVWNMLKGSVEIKTIVQLNAGIV
ncbi:MAG: OsmC family protein [Bacteroidales bacterium]